MVSSNCNNKNSDYPDPKKLLDFINDFYKHLDNVDITASNELRQLFQNMAEEQKTQRELDRLINSLSENDKKILSNEIQESRQAISEDIEKLRQQRDLLENRIIRALDGKDIIGKLGSRLDSIGKILDIGKLSVLALEGYKNGNSDLWEGYKNGHFEPFLREAGKILSGNLGGGLAVSGVAAILALPAVPVVAPIFGAVLAGSAFLAGNAVGESAFEWLADSIKKYFDDEVVS